MDSIEVRTMSQRRSALANQDLLTTINKVVNELREAKNLEPVIITREMPLLNEMLSLDSLDLAALLIELETLTGYDPFAEGFVNFQTAGELTDLYIAQ